MPALFRLPPVAPCRAAALLRREMDNKGLLEHHEGLTGYPIRAARVPREAIGDYHQRIAKRSRYFMYSEQK